MIQPVADNVWYYPPHPDSEAVQPGVGIVITERETVLIDAGNSPRHAYQIRAALKLMDAPPVRYVIYTHHHWDHTFGAQAWYGSIIVSHALCRALMQEHYASQPWSQRYIQEQSYLEPRRAPGLQAMNHAIADWSRFRLMLPQITFSEHMSLVLDGMSLTLKHVGGQHAADSIIVQAGEVLFLGDCCYPPPQPLRQPEDTLDFAMIESLLEINAAWYIDAHGLPRTPADVRQLLEQA